MFAIVKVGASQYMVSEGDTIEVNRLEGEKDKAVALDKVLLFANGDDVRIGRPYVKEVSVTARIAEHTKGKKVFSFKFKRRKDSKIKKGHRQKLTSLVITKISA